MLPCFCCSACCSLIQAGQAERGGSAASDAAAPAGVQRQGRRAACQPSPTLTTGRGQRRRRPRRCGWPAGSGGGSGGALREARSPCLPPTAGHPSPSTPLLPFCSHPPGGAPTAARGPTSPRRRSGWRCRRRSSMQRRPLWRLARSARISRGSQIAVQRERAPPKPIGGPSLSTSQRITAPSQRGPTPQPAPTGRHFSCSLPAFAAIKTKWPPL